MGSAPAPDEPSAGSDPSLDSGAESQEVTAEAHKPEAESSEPQSGITDSPQDRPADCDSIAPGSPQADSPDPDSPDPDSLESGSPESAETDAVAPAPGKRPAKGRRAARKPRSRAERVARRRRRVRRILIWGSASLALLIVLVVAAGYALLRHFNGNIEQANIAGLLGKQPVKLHPQAENILV